MRVIACAVAASFLLDARMGSSGHNLEPPSVVRVIAFLLHHYGTHNHTRSVALALFLRGLDTYRTRRQRRGFPFAPLGPPGSGSILQTSLYLNISSGHSTLPRRPLISTNLFFSDLDCSKW